MNKIQDGFASIEDSYKPITLTTDRRHFASLSFVGEQVILRPGSNAELVLEHSGPDSLVFRIAPRTATQPEPDTDVAQETEPQESAPALG